MEFLKEVIYRLKIVLQIEKMVEVAFYRNCEVVRYSYDV